MCSSRSSWTTTSLYSPIIFCQHFGYLLCTDFSIANRLNYNSDISMVHLKAFIEFYNSDSSISFNESISLFGLIHNSSCFAIAEPDIKVSLSLSKITINSTKPIFLLCLHQVHFFLSWIEILCQFFAFSVCLEEQPFWKKIVCRKRHCNFTHCSLCF